MPSQVSKKFGLLPRILFAIVLGIACGQFFPHELTRVFVTFNGVFGNFLSFIIPLIIVGLITPAISELGKGAGKWLAVTAAIAYVSTISSGLLGWATSTVVLPHLLAGRSVSSVTNPADSLLKPYFTIEMPPVFNVMTALVLAFMVGVALTTIRGDVLLRGFCELREMVNKVISAVVIPLLPIYIFGIFLNMTAVGEVFNVITTFLGVIVMVFALTWVVLFVQYAIAGLVARRNPLVLLKTLLPAYVTALGTSSSAATIPVTLRQTVKTGVSEPVASFTVPLCATIHLAGSTVKIVSFSLAVMMLSGKTVDPWLFLGFILMLGITMVAAPGVPGGAIMTAAGLLASMLGFTDPQVGLMIATYIAIDSFGTATNVTGDGALATIVDKLVLRDQEKKKSLQQIPDAP
ncbi:dicarboxylate/amino acid:cation symporter [Dermatophilus congolensis]|uniref:dicarboxylate/amino acid:cation symporter n=1 Tax=Dermatophilus congolensis TaxID=1863 RepID=UPI001AAFC6B9|nr:dicarboxylate/amino acid:cation symporter [Dermatophilus congolensis]MBO3143214.1 dicarboxylate/amino acid:cation symporter [Dermatophilus congolensis]MBO3152198.1 dicarboxylate/amino acid:cation symporter [Dermatophilus congolensis]MBO3160789.1 dicarboxylate/amino acid:cation symporter [Dermatophilus congolensis]MBO3163489.1 dicarboxylate/amino acid:cation symporter [Dermatophilus congolensis]MBO3177035.1 dicarboxylate/amino acid:cation symporter [Dermatophilus congolensis]